MSGYGAKADKPNPIPFRQLLTLIGLGLFPGAAFLDATQGTLNSLEILGFCSVANPTALIRAQRHHPLMLKMVVSSEFGGPAMTQFSSQQDSSFPYVLVCSTLGTLVSLASVWIFTAMSFAPVMVA